jgi:DNA-binding response OmpR family regulator
MAKGRHVLLVEDEPSIAEAIRFLLIRDGCEVTTLGNGSEVMPALHKTPFDVVILDMMLPGASGLDVLAAIRADTALAALPVLMLTAKGQPHDRAAAEHAGANRFMTKPFANADMVAEVRALLDG